MGSKMGMGTSKKSLNSQGQGGQPRGQKGADARPSRPWVGGDTEWGWRWTEVWVAQQRGKAWRRSEVLRPPWPVQLYTPHTPAACLTPGG